MISSYIGVLQCASESNSQWRLAIQGNLPQVILLVLGSTLYCLTWMFGLRIIPSIPGKDFIDTQCFHRNPWEKKHGLEWCCCPPCGPISLARYRWLYDQFAYLACFKRWTIWEYNTETISQVPSRATYPIAFGEAAALASATPSCWWTTTTDTYLTSVERNEPRLCCNKPWIV